ncbi:MAG: hypothetical protein Tsb0015_09410 [Simkaniaceae bacterium]
MQKTIRKIYQAILNADKKGNTSLILSAKDIDWKPMPNCEALEIEVLARTFFQKYHIALEGYDFKTENAAVDFHLHFFWEKHIPEKNMQDPIYIKVQNRVFPCEAAVLQQCQYFADMTNKPSELALEGHTDAKSFLLFYELLKSGLPNLLRADMTTLLGIFHLLLKFQAQEHHIRHFINVIAHRLNKENAPEVLKTAEAFNITDLKNLSTKFLKQES